MKKVALNFLPAVLFFILSLLLLTIPGSDLPKVGLFSEIPYFDKWVHIGMFGIFTYLLGAAMYKTFQQNSRLLLWPVFIGVVYGVAMEFVQKYWIPNRSFDYWDILADTIGCLIGYLSLRIRFRNTPRTRTV